MEALELTALDKWEFAQLLELWQGFMHGRPMWAGLMRSAAAADYDTVSRVLAARFE